MGQNLKFWKNTFGLLNWLSPMAWTNQLVKWYQSHSSNWFGRKSVFIFKDSWLKFNELPSQVTEVHQPVCTSVHDPVQTFTIRHNKTSLKVDLWNNSRHGHSRSKKVSADVLYLKTLKTCKMAWKAGLLRTSTSSTSWVFEALADVLVFIYGLRGRWASFWNTKQKTQDENKEFGNPGRGRPAEAWSKGWTFECLMDVKNVSKRNLGRKCILKLHLMRGWEQNNFD